MDEINIAWDLVGKVGAAMAVLVGIIQAYKYLRSQTSVAKLEEKVSMHSDYLQKDKEHLERIDIRLDNIENQNKNEFEQINKSLDMLGSSMASLINHMIDGNGLDKMKEERDKLTNFFISRD